MVVEAGGGGDGDDDGVDDEVEVRRLKPGSESGPQAREVRSSRTQL